MSTARTLAGLVGVLVVATGWATAGAAAGRAWASDLPAPLRQATQAVLALVGLLLTSALLGTGGLLAPWPLVATAVVAGLSGVHVLRRPGAFVRRDPGDRRPRRHDPLLGGAAAIVAVRWGAELLQTLSRGFSHADELHYHLTHSALFVQSGETWPIRFASVGDGSAYHPAHSELLHAVGLAVLGSDFLSIFLNLGFGVLALAAGWAIGRQAGNAGAGALVVAAALSLPLVVAESGSALNDTMAIALLLLAAALLLEAHTASGPARLVTLAGLAAGAAVGTKLTVLVAAVALVPLVLAVPGARRLARAAAYVGGAVVAGGYWYLRNLAHTANPVPALSFGPLPGPELRLQREVEFPVLDYVTDVDVWRDWFVPGLERFLGPLWPVLPGLVLVAAVAALARWRTDRRWALLALAGTVSLAGYVATPTSAAGGPGTPSLFAFNLRYAVPGALLCGLAGLAHPALRRNPRTATGVAFVAFVAANLHGADPGRTMLATAGVVAVAAGAWAASRAPRHGPVLVASALGVVVLGLLGSLVLHDRYLDRRWRADLARWPAYEAGDRARGVAVGITGFPQSYPFFGRGLDNRVVTIGDDHAGDELLPHETCEGWWGDVDDADLDVVVVLDEAGMHRTDLGRLLVDDPTSWLRASGAPVVLRDRAAAVFDVRDATPTCGPGSSTGVLDAEER